MTAIRLRLGSSRTSTIVSECGCSAWPKSLASVEVLARRSEPSTSSVRGPPGSTSGSSSSLISIGGGAGGAPLGTSGGWICRYPAPATPAVVAMKTVNTPAKAFASTAAPTRGGRSVRLRRHDIRVKRNERSGTSDRLACWQPVVNRRPTIAAAATLVVLAAPAPAGAARPKAPELTRIRCVPSTTATCKTSIKVTIGRQLQLSGKRITKGMRVSFRWSRGALATKLDHTRVGYVARVPAGTKAGAVSVTVSDRAGRRSNAIKITVVAPPRIGGTVVAPGVL